MHYEDLEHAHDRPDGFDEREEDEEDLELDPWALDGLRERTRAPARAPGRRTRVASRYQVAQSRGAVATGAKAESKRETLSSLEAELGAGQPLDGATASRMSEALGVDVSRARIHGGPKAAQKAREAGALAFAVGSNVVLGADAPQAGTLEGDALLAHELAHVAQQSGAAADPRMRKRPIGGESEAAEADADRAAAGALAHLYGGPAIAQQRGDAMRTGLQLQRCPPNRRQPRAPQPQPQTPQQRAQALIQELQTLTDGATWAAIRRTAYPAESAAGVTRARERHAGRQPDLTGLGSNAVLDRFAAECHRLQRAWGPLTPAERRDQLGAAASAELVRANVPGFLHVRDIVTEFKGQFSPTEWTFEISRALITGPNLSDDDAAELCNTTLHEARHAEQQFLAARFQAEQGRTAAQIAGAVGIPMVIATEAHRRRLTGASAQVRDLAQRMNQAVVTDGAANQAISNNDGLAELERRRTTALTALAALRANPTPQAIANAERERDALRAQIAEVRRLYTLYRNIPYEADAHEVGDAAEQAFRGWR
jgi:hypothetical protein